MQSEPKTRNRSVEADDDSKLRKVVEGLFEEWSHAWTNKDTSKASRFYSKAPDLVFFDLGPTHLGWERYEQSIHRSFESIANLRLSLNKDALRVVVRDRIGITTASGQISYTMIDGTDFESSVRFTGVWEKAKEGNWQLIHEHWSRQTPRK